MEEAGAGWEEEVAFGGAFVESWEDEEVELVEVEVEEEVEEELEEREEELIFARVWRDWRIRSAFSTTRGSSSFAVVTIWL